MGVENLIEGFALVYLALLPDTLGDMTTSKFYPRQDGSRGSCAFSRSRTGFMDPEFFGCKDLEVVPADRGLTRDDGRCGYRGRIHGSLMSLACVASCDVLVREGV